MDELLKPALWKNLVIEVHILYDFIHMKQSEEGNLQRHKRDQCLFKPGEDVVIWGVIANEHEFYLGGDTNIVESRMMMVAQLCEYTGKKNH